MHPNLFGYADVFFAHVKQLKTSSACIQIWSVISNSDICSFVKIHVKRLTLQILVHFLADTLQVKVLISDLHIAHYTSMS